MSSRYTCALAGLMFATGCATSAEIVTALEPARDIPPEVRCSDPCTDEWQRAQFWLTTYARLRLQTVTDVVLETYSPGENDAIRAFSVTREPVGGGEFVIRIAQYCGNILGCNPPNDREVEQAFLYYVQTGTDLVRGLGFRPDQ